MNSTGNTSKLIMAFVTLLIGIVLIGPVATEGNSRTKTLVADEQFTIARNATDIDTAIEYTFATLGSTSVDCPVTSYTIANSTEEKELTETTHYVLDTGTGVFTVTNTSFVFINEDNLTNATYTYCPIGYMNQGWGRTAIDLAPGFFAIALLLTSIALFYSVLQDFKGV